MSEQLRILNATKCVECRLWYTFSIIITQLNNSCSTELETLIKYIISTQDDNRRKWISHAISWKLFNDIFLHDGQDLQMKLANIQLSNAVRLTTDIPDTIRRDPLTLFDPYLNSYSECVEVSNEETKNNVIFLRKNVQEHTWLLCWIINELSCVRSNDLSCDTYCTTENIYSFLLKHLFKQYRNTNKRNCQDVGRILCVISKSIGIQPNTFTTWIFPELTKVNNLMDAELTFYSREDVELLKMWNVFLDRVHGRTNATSNVDDVWKIINAMFSFSSNSVTCLNKKELLQRIVKKESHWLLDILDSCCILVTDGRNDIASGILSYDLCQGFRPVLLFYSLYKYSQAELDNLNIWTENTDIRKSLDYISKSFHSVISNNVTLCNIDMILTKSMKVVDWIFNEGNYNEAEISSKSISKQKSQVVSTLLQGHNVLSILKENVNIHEASIEQIVDVLREFPNCEKIYRGYYCVLLALKAIASCEMCFSAKRTVITDYFNDMESYLNALYPVDVKLKTIQDIFSLLFLRYEDFDTEEKDYYEDDSTISNKKANFLEQTYAGFVCNRYAVINILYNLNNVVTSIEQTDLNDEDEKALFKLKKILEDAVWRMKLCVNTFLSEDVENIDKNQHPSTTIPLDGEMNFPHFIKNNSLFYKKSENIPDETKIRSDSSSDTTIIQNGRSRERSRNANWIMSEQSTLRNISQKQIIGSMLSSKESLVLQCMWRSNYTKAQEILEMSEMTNTQLDGEVRFANAFQQFRRDISKVVHRSDDTNASKEKSTCSTLDNIRLAAQEGIRSSRHANQFETFLASQETRLRTTSTDSVQSTRILTLSALDLALTVDKPHQTSCNLCDIAVKYLKSCTSLENSEHARFFTTIRQLIHENKEETSAMSILCDAKIPLCTKEWTERNEFWYTLENKYNEFVKLERKKVTLDTQTDDIGGHCHEFQILRRITSSFGTDKKYLQDVNSHLQLLLNILPEKLDIAYTNVASTLLKIPLHSYFGYQIFDLNIELSKLELIAHNLQVNLVHTILTNLCPNVTYNEKKDSTWKETNTSSYIILNNNLEKTTKDRTVRNPNEFVETLLNDLINALLNFNAGQYGGINDLQLKRIADDPTIKSIFDRTSYLTNLDLSELSIGEEIITFFINIWNVMFIHTLLRIWSNDPPFNDFKHSISLMSIGYTIGDLGFVTLAALRSKLFGDLGDNSSYFIHVDELNEPAWQDFEPMQDPRVIFAMANEFRDTPRIRVYRASTLNKDLNEAARDYLDYHIRKHKSTFAKSNENSSHSMPLTLPNFVKDYQRNILQSFKDDGYVNNDNGLFSVDEYIDNYENITHEDVRYVRVQYSYEIILKYTDYMEQIPFKTDLEPFDCPILNRKHPINQDLLGYLNAHCWILSYLAQRMSHDNAITSNDIYEGSERTIYLENLLNTTWIKELERFFDNEILTASHEVLQENTLWSYFETSVQNRQWNDCLNIVNSLPDNARTFEIQSLRDHLLKHSILNTEFSPEIKVLNYLYEIKNIHVLAQTILYNIDKWHINVCEHALLHVLHHEDREILPVHRREQMERVLHRVKIFHKMLPYCANECDGTWYDVVYCTRKVDPFRIIDSLLNADKFELCLEWLECQSFPLDMQSSIMQDFLIGLLKNKRERFEHASKLLQLLPLNQSMKICKGIVKKLECADALHFVGNYLLRHCKTNETTKYKKLVVGIEILKELDPNERILYVHLVKDPLLILEQLLMNCKFESIQKILEKISERIEDAMISLTDFDETIKFYATKSLDFRVSLERDGIDGKTRNIPLRSETTSTEFVMPPSVPTKDEWIPNDKARECSCCRSTIFSMFNRRHHCRRCGRVVCAVCSQHRMHVAGYPSSVLVRVCDDCKGQTALQIRAIQDAPSTPSSEAFDYWRLTRDKMHNQSIREEFSFEYAPSISLCLSILNLHSNHQKYTSFLLDRCHEMKELLQPVNGGKMNPEIDHVVIIKMIRSLLVAVKVKCAKLGFNTGLTHCDRFLSQIDLIATLARSDCLALLPSDDLDEHALRKLRDLLAEKEEWTLALDVSTKAGLDTQGVWAAWGKACLKVGCFELARDKFSHCLDKIATEELDDFVIVPRLRERINSGQSDELKTKENDFKESQFVKRYEKTRPMKNSPLLVEILQILENIGVNGYFRQQYLNRRSKSAHEILSSLNTLKNTCQGCVLKQSTKARNACYEESLYYLLTYGCYGSILEFFVRHEEFSECLNYVLENNVEPELFFNSVYLYSLKNGNTEKLHEAIRVNDSSLFTWKKYLIFICRSLERKQYLHILYQLQLFMKDYVRASMTCIRFYLNDSSTYSTLNSKVHLLHEAQKHLESELQIEALSRRRRRSVSSSSSNQSGFIMEMEPSEIDKHVNTICRQMEVTKFLGNAENEGRHPYEFLTLFPDYDYDNTQMHDLPTLFGDQRQKTHLAVLAILCGRDIEEGFGIAFRILQDYNLSSQKVYSLAGHILALRSHVPAIEQLIKCCRSSGAPNSLVISDHVLTHCVKLLLDHAQDATVQSFKNQVDGLIRSITDIELKISAYIDSKQLKAAYLLAVKYSRAQDIRKILKESDRLGQNAIKAICVKWLQQNSK